MTPADNDAVTFWQMVADAAYAIEGENRQFEREYLSALALELDRWLAARPEVKNEPGSPLGHFAMHAVKRLAAAFIFNDSIGADVIRPFSTIAGDGAVLVPVNPDDDGRSDP
jgi:hypothetical protein